MTKFEEAFLNAVFRAGSGWNASNYQDVKEICDNLISIIYKENIKVNKILKYIWIEAKKEEPKELDKIICLYHPNFRDKIIICDKYNSKEKKFYYEDGEYYNDISLNYPNLKWTYVENLISKE